MRKKWIAIVPVAITAMIVVTFVGGQVVKLLWNWLMPPLFGWPLLTFWQALGLLVLCRILFGGLGRQPSRSGWGRRWDKMTPEEREQVRQRMRARWGFGSATGESAGQ